MDPNLSEQRSQQSAAVLTCPKCHQPVSPQYYFCPNCGAGLHDPPLRTDALTQAGIYAFSIILPVICYLLISKWPGLKYYRSQDERARTVGAVAFGLLILSSAVTFWYAYEWTQEQIQQATGAINADMSI